MKTYLTGFFLLTAISYAERSNGHVIDFTKLSETNIDDNVHFTNLLQLEDMSQFNSDYNDFDPLNIAEPVFLEKYDLKASKPPEVSNVDHADSVNEKITTNFSNGVSLNNLLQKKLSIPFFSKLFKGDKYVKYLLYTRETLNCPEVIDSRQLTEFKNLKPDKPIIIIVHGWRGYDECLFSTYMRNGFLPLKDVNLVSVDWSGHHSRTFIYPFARYQVPQVGYLLAQFLDFLVTKHNVNLSDMHIIGHSLGAHIAGVAGDLVKNGKIGRITGLDPAGPEFKWTNLQGRLSPESALFVDVIHTAAHYLGLADQLGHVDFYPNGGRAIQPGCGMDIVGMCSHRRSFMFYVDTLTNPHAYPAVSCNNWNDFRTYKCRYSSIAFMGEIANKSTYDQYFLQTNNKSPFWRASDGIYFSGIY